jgi:plastocyanin
MMKNYKWLAICILPGLALAGCGKKESTEEQPATPAAATPAATTAPIDPATAATISGSVKFDGPAPKADKIDMSQDPNCAGSNTAENVVVADGHLANVFVYVKEGLGDRTFPVPTEAVTLTQVGCKYKPHVIGVMAGQTIKIVNGDPTTHNIHPSPKDNREWNESQAPQAPALEKTFAREELLLPVKCNQHPWMRMFINVVKNPFYAVTGPDGKYQIAGLPPGDYTIVFVQEKLGQQEQKVTLAAKDSKTLDASFKAQ